MTREELAQYDGKDGRKAYFAYKGKVYDVTESRMWKQGTHMRRHNAGEDLTEALSAAPHAEEVLVRFPMVGELDAEVVVKTQKEKMQDLYHALHPHPMIIHFPMGLFMFAAAMQVLYLMFAEPSFESAAFYALCGATLTMFPAIASGFLSWWLNYNAGMNKFFRFKIIFSIVLITLGMMELVMRVFYGAPASPADVPAVYTLLVLVNVPVLGVIGFNGGKITWS